MPEPSTHSGFGDFRMTKQRKVVYEVLMDERDHPTASEVFMRAKGQMPGISLATVYNCLETMTQAGLIKQVNVDREASRYCPNLRPHAHFFCSECHQISDIDLRNHADIAAVWDMPEGSRIDHVDVAMKGVCPHCGAAKQKTSS
ncbi:MAG: transcriptional repressor [Verrucomicrobiae bacterium]|nr:transcriptional repressor [Verrucomicrobiae bacterium]